MTRAQRPGDAISPEPEQSKTAKKKDYRRTQPKVTAKDAEWWFLWYCRMARPRRIYDFAAWLRSSHPELFDAGEEAPSLRTFYTWSSEGNWIARAVEYDRKESDKLLELIAQDTAAAGLERYLQWKEIADNLRWLATQMQKVLIVDDDGRPIRDAEGNPQYRLRAPAEFMPRTPFTIFNVRNTIETALLVEKQMPDMIPPQIAAKLQEAAGGLSGVRPIMLPEQVGELAAQFGDFIREIREQNATKRHELGLTDTPAMGSKRRTYEGDIVELEDEEEDDDDFEMIRNERDELIPAYVDEESEWDAGS